MIMDGFISRYSAIQDLAGSGQPLTVLARALGDLPAQIPGNEAVVTHRELPGMNSASLRAWAKTISQLDPDVLAYHATGRGQEFLENFDMAEILQRIACPVLLLRANPALGALMSEEAADHLLSVLPDAIQVELDNAGHDLGLDTWEVGPLLRAVTDFLETLL